MANDEAGEKNVERGLFSFVALSVREGRGGGAMPAKVSAKSSTAEQVAKAGTKLASDYSRRGGGVLLADRSEGGFTLVEALVVLAIIGFIAILASVQISNIWQKSRLNAEAGNLSAFLQSAYTYMVNNRAPVFVRLVPGSAGGSATTVTITQNFDGSGTLFDTYTLPTFATLDTSGTSSNGLDSNTVWPCACTGTCTISSSTPGVLELDTMGRAENPFCANATQVTAAQTLLMTHVNMVTGSLTPKIVYTLQVFPLWKVQKTP